MAPANDSLIFVMKNTSILFVWAFALMLFVSTTALAGPLSVPARQVVVSSAPESPARRPFIRGDYYRNISIYQIENPGTSAAVVGDIDVRAEGLSEVFIVVGGGEYRAVQDTSDSRRFYAQVNLTVDPGKAPRVAIYGNIKYDATDVSAALDGFGGEYDYGTFLTYKTVVHGAFDALPVEGLTNVSVRTPVSPTGVTILGIHVEASPGHPCAVLLRAVGPGLKKFGMTAVLTDPLIKVFDSNGTLIAEQDNWQGLEGLFAISGAFPLDKLDSAVLLWLSSGSYTVQVKGFGTGQGDVLIEAYRVSGLTPKG